MSELWEVHHPYYCNQSNFYAPGNVQPVGRYDSWQDFFDAEGQSDPDMNLLFRWDWREADPEEKDWGNDHETLMLFWMGQRKGLYRWSEVKVAKTDAPAVREWLKQRWEHMKLLWAPISGD